MAYRIQFSPYALENLAELTTDASKLKKVVRAIYRVSQDPRYGSLNSHKFDGMTGEKGEEVWESYVENHTPGAYRIYWYYGPTELGISVVAILKHPS
jgi:hypothetical protein